MYNILGVNPGHNGSIALISDGELVYYIEEERLSRQKYDGNPFRAILDVLSKWKIDCVVVGGTTAEIPRLPWTGEDPYTALVRKHNNPKVESITLGQEHHLGHAACAFYNSGFDKAIAIIVDGAGSLHQTAEFSGYETESIWECSYPNDFTLKYRSYGNNFGYTFDNGLDHFDGAVTITKAYEAVSQYLRFGFIEAGKTMGLAPYGKEDKNIPELFVAGRGSKDIFMPSYPAGAYIDQNRVPYLKLDRDEEDDWHKDPSKLTDAEKNLAWKIQHDTQKMVGDLIEEQLEKSDTKNVVIAGGYGLNCVANYYLRKRFPDINLYCEPISNDGGTAIGIAKYVWYSKNLEDVTIRSQKTLYHGPEYTTEQIQETLDKHSDKISVEKTTYAEVAKLIADRNIVALFQGRSEAGPRALGNRSILYDPTDPNGKDFVNTVKGREWFRPFAASALKEHSSEWFDLAGMDESPFMMYAVNIHSDKVDKIPCVSHVDGTCRIQTVSKEQNLHYHSVISEFHKLTGVPLVFNTSFNLAGDPLVETIEDALNTLYKSDMKYLYLPELQVLVTKC